MRNLNREKRAARMRRHVRVRRKVRGTAARPRLCVYRSLGHIYAQIIDDEAKQTLASASSLHLELPAPAAPEAAAPQGKEGKPGKDGKEGKGKKPPKPLSLKMRRSQAVGKAIAEAALAKGIKAVAFDRGGYIYHGRVAALAEAARKAGLEL